MRLLLGILPLRFGRGLAIRLFGFVVQCWIFDGACRTFGWGIAQVVTLLSPNVVVVGGGVSLVGEGLFLLPLRDYVNRYVFPPLSGTFEIRRASLGEEVVLYEVLALAAAG